jgi:hypothetical protein
VVEHPGDPQAGLVVYEARAARSVTAAAGPSSARRRRAVTLVTAVVVAGRLGYHQTAQRAAIQPLADQAFAALRHEAWGQRRW